MKICTELKEISKAEGYTMRANINPDCIKTIMRWNKKDGRAVAKAIRDGDVKKAIYHMDNAKLRNRILREISAKHDKIIYLNGEEWGIFEADTRKCYAFVK